LGGCRLTLNNKQNAAKPRCTQEGEPASRSRMPMTTSLLRIFARAHHIQARLIENSKLSVHDIARETSDAIHTSRGSHDSMKYAGVPARLYGRFMNVLGNAMTYEIYIFRAFVRSRFLMGFWLYTFETNISRGQLSLGKPPAIKP
jgi:hypothetical protein